MVAIIKKRKECKSIKKVERRREKDHSKQFNETIVARFWGRVDGSSLFASSMSKILRGKERAAQTMFVRDINARQVPMIPMIPCLITNP